MVKLICKAIIKTLLICALPIMVVGILELLGNVAIIAAGVAALAVLFYWAYNTEVDKQAAKEEAKREEEKRAKAYEAVDKEANILFRYVEEEYDCKTVHQQVQTLLDAVHAAKYYEKLPHTYVSHWYDKIANLLKSKNYL